MKISHINDLLRSTSILYVVKASKNGRKEVVRLLIDNGATVNEKDNKGRTALMMGNDLTK